MKRKTGWAEAENKVVRIVFQCSFFVREDIREHIAIERLTAFSEAFLCDKHTQVVGIEAYVAALNETR